MNLIVKAASFDTTHVHGAWSDRREV